MLFSVMCVVFCTESRRLMLALDPGEKASAMAMADAVDLTVEKPIHIFVPTQVQVPGY